MGRAARREQLARTLNSYAQSIHETFQVFDEPAAPTLEKVDWSEVTKLGDEVSKQATITGMLWTGETPDARELEENIGTYCNVLQGFLLVCHGNTVGAGPTLQACIRASAKQVIDCSLSLLREAVSSYGSFGSDKKTAIPQLSGSVWEACAVLNKTPTSNCMAIGRAITQIAVSVKDVLREMRELKPAAIDSGDETPETSNITHEAQKDDSASEGALGNDLSPEEMDIANLAIDVVSDTLTVVKESIRFLTDLIKKPVHGATPENNVHSLEQILKYYQETGVQVDELGACLYPPQEVPLIRATTEKMLQLTNGIRTEVQNILGSSEALIRSLEVLESSLRKLQLGAVHPDTDVVQEMGGLSV
ncbi:hypothetical protein Taro_002138 [Colocasia esculenta]|uniref:Uncharacterized protein n=1 Tax=Colocasia esculenta TaxID=4460 RepID=A0A843TKP8_COLES|nr:hypothetical protein [Colocasia esculenta]